MDLMAVDGEPYGYGRVCQWHGPLTFAGRGARFDTETGDAEHVCPKCGRALIVTDSDSFWRTVASSEKAIPQYTEMLRWSEGKCFPDFATMQDAFRQAMEE